MATELQPATAAEADAAASRPRWQPTLGTFIWLFALAWGIFLGLQPVRDNSTLTHIATGRIIFDTGFPRADPYLFTPHAASWVVQSWLASTLYWALIKAWGIGAIVGLQGVLTAVLALLIVRLARPADGFIARLALVALTLGVGASAWAPRPLMIGLVLLGILLIAADGGLDPRWLVPVMYVWVNAHGSFPLGLVALGLLWLGRRLDREEGTTEWRCLLWATVGVVAGAINPYGPKLLVFPVLLLQRSDVLRNIIEWKAPTFDALWQQLFLVQIAAAIFVLVRRPSWRLALPMIVLIPAALYSARNILVASLVLTAAMAPSLKGLGDLKADARLSSPIVAWAGAAALVVLCFATLVTPVGQPSLDLRSYPVQALAFARDEGLVPPPDGSQGRLLAQDFVGNLREYLDGPIGDVFVDDRAEVFDKQTADDYVTLLAGTQHWKEVLDRHDIQTVVWQRGYPLSVVLTESPDWQLRYSDPGWIVAVRRHASR